MLHEPHLAICKSVGRRWYGDPASPLVFLLDRCLHHPSFGRAIMLLVGMILLGLAAFAALVGFIGFCDWV